MRITPTKPYRICAPGTISPTASGALLSTNSGDMTADRSAPPSSSRPCPRLSNDRHGGAFLNKVVIRLAALYDLFPPIVRELASEENPWKALAPASDVWTLADALAGRFDRFYGDGADPGSVEFCASGAYLVKTGEPDAAVNRKGHRREKG